MKTALVNDKIKSVRALFKEFGCNITRWPKAVCPECKKATYFYGKPGLLYHVLRRKLPEGTGEPSFRHFPNEAENCPLAINDFTRNGKSVTDMPLDPSLAKEACLSPLNFERVKAVLWKVLGPRNHSSKNVRSLIANADDNNLWQYGFPSWATAYVLLLNSEIDYTFNTNRKIKVRFNVIKIDDTPHLAMVFADTERPVNLRYYAYPITAEATDGYLERYKQACDLVPSFGNGVPHQTTMYDRLAAPFSTTRPCPASAARQAFAAKHRGQAASPR